MTTLVHITCYRCSVPFGLERTSYEHLKRSSQEFHCPYGHKQHFVAGKSEAEKLREQLDEERRRRQRVEQDRAYHIEARESAERSARAFKGQVTRLRNRAKAGVCPCCNRHFSQLERHMASQHPDFTGEPE
ncbi:hypothetical protein [Sphingobium sp. YR657]|uniref:hypothetical protein n=1 Tax=Sphingobium sp. YR657 TaxID=1884366 RepID=UPI003137FDB3